jgi:energy-coupling factor transporter transmembrane protein EcfT
LGREEVMFDILKSIYFHSEFDEKKRKRKTTLKIDPEDLIALGGVLVAIIMAVAMALGTVPINKYTAGIVCFSACGAAIAKIINARHKHPTGSAWVAAVLVTIIIILVIAFGAYVWATSR